MLIRWLALATLRIVMIALGILAVPLGLPFRSTGPSVPFTQYPGEWALVRLPAWLRPWDNEFDGMLGDKRGWWNNNRLVGSGEDCRTFRSMFLWGAIRNPANYFSRRTAGCDVSQCVITKKYGDDYVVEQSGVRCWHLLSAESIDGTRYFRFFCVLPWWFNPDKAFEIDLGWKIKLSHNGTTEQAEPQDRFKGIVMLVTPWKDIS